MPKPSPARAIGRAVALGAITGVFSLVYLFLVEEGTHALWGDEGSTEWFSGGVWSIVIPIGAGLLIGLTYVLLKLPARFDGFISELQDGHVEPSTAPGALLVAVISLIGGASLGPEAPLGTAGGAAGTWLARRAGADEERVRVATFTGISGAFGGLLSTPLGGPLLAFELEHEQTHSYYFNHLVPGVIAGAVSFGILYPTLGAPFLGLYDVPTADFRSWMLLAGVGIGLFGAVAAILIGRTIKAITTLMSPLDSRPILRGLVGGAAIAAIAFTSPLTLFSGVDGLVPIIDNPTQFGVLALVILAILKTMAMSVSIGGGFYGGTIFPMFFIGGTLGVVVHIIFPAIPIGLALGATMSAVGGTLAMIPLAMTIITSLLVKADFLMSGAILMAAITGFTVRYLLENRDSAGPDAPETMQR
ncbi:MAG: chloride channel protein [Actinomycetota bacterium]|nr:chloride channel protein [Actinomycetota bacterium]